MSANTPKWAYPCTRGHEVGQHTHLHLGDLEGWVCWMCQQMDMAANAAFEESAGIVEKYMRNVYHDGVGGLSDGSRKFMLNMTNAIMAEIRAKKVTG